MGAHVGERAAGADGDAARHPAQHQRHTTRGDAARALMRGAPSVKLAAAMREARGCFEARTNAARDAAPSLARQLVATVVEMHNLEVCGPSARPAAALRGDTAASRAVAATMHRRGRVELRRRPAGGRRAVSVALRRLF